MMPKIRYYALFEDVTEGKTAKYAITRQAGYYEPMEKIKGKDGKVSVFLLESASSGSGSNAPAMRLMAKASLNLTGLKEYFVDGGKLSGYAYGYPLATPTYGKEKRPNPFYGYREDGFCLSYTKGKDSKGRIILKWSCWRTQSALYLLTARCCRWAALKRNWPRYARWRKRANLFIIRCIL